MLESKKIVCRLLFARKNFDLLLLRVTKHLFKINFFSTKYPKFLSEFCITLITDYLVTVVLFLRVFLSLDNITTIMFPFLGLQFVFF